MTNPDHIIPIRAEFAIGGKTYFNFWQCCTTFQMKGMMISVNFQCAVLNDRSKIVKQQLRIEAHRCRLPANISHFCTHLLRKNNFIMANVQLSLRRKSGEFHLESTNQNGNTVDTDGSPDIGGQGNGLRPMELLLASLSQLQRH